MSSLRAGLRPRRLPAFVGILVLLVVIVTMTVPALGCAKEGEGVPQDQEWTGGNWSVAANKVTWSGCFLYVRLTITHTGDRIANFGYDNQDSVGSLYIRDNFGAEFEIYAPYPWQEPFYEDSFYPDEVREGVAEYKIDPRSESVRMFMRPEYTNIANLDFDLGAVPESCRR